MFYLGKEFQGLNNTQIDASARLHGRNRIEEKKSFWLWELILGVLNEPMVVLLLAASVLYFITGDTGDAIFLGVAIVLVGGISVYQDRRSEHALNQLQKYTQPSCKAIRNGNLETIPAEDVVVGDLIIAEEGSLIVADGKLLHSLDFTVDESLLTGESLAVYKSSEDGENEVFSGTTVIKGVGVVEVTAVGTRTRLGKIGASLEAIKAEKTPLEIQIANFVRKMVFIGLAFFLVVWAINYFNDGSLIESLLKALTLAMSILPEEIPVAFATFMAIGSWRLMQKGIIVRQNQTVEVLGAATVICADKTGTITQNKMNLDSVYLPGNGIISKDKFSSELTGFLILYAKAASDQLPYDPMEVALHEASDAFAKNVNFKVIKQYSLSGKPPMMSNVMELNGEKFIAVKGAPEAIFQHAHFTSEEEKAKAMDALNNLAAQGYRVLGVAGSKIIPDHLPENQQDFKVDFLGLVALADPPKENIPSVLDAFYNAGVKLKILTGDNSTTTKAIADKIGFKDNEYIMEGKEIESKTDEELQEVVERTGIFTRLFPEAKLRIIRALKSSGEIVAMTGDGINDGPALKAAHIGVAMGKNGTEVAKQSAALVLSDDDLSKMVDAIAMGRKIYDNLKKAIQYIISIHIPIILIVFVPLALGWLYPNIFTPVHVIFLELIMGPTCSIVYEQEPMEAGTMNRPPKPFTQTFFNFRELSVSILQGLVIAVACLTAYKYAIHQGYGENLTRTMTFITLIVSNIFLTLVNRSFRFPIWVTLGYKNKLIAGIIGLTVLLNVLMLTIPSLTSFFHFESLNFSQLLICIGLGMAGTLWMEVVKLVRR